MSTTWKCLVCCKVWSWSVYHIRSGVFSSVFGLSLALLIDLVLVGTVDVRVKSRTLMPDMVFMPKRWKEDDSAASANEAVDVIYVARRE